MGKGLIIAIIVIVLAAAAYVYLYGIPGNISIPTSITGGEVGAAVSAVESIVADTGEEIAATEAASVANETASEISAADNLEVPDVQ